MGYQMIHIYKGFQLARAWRSKIFEYGGERLPAHVRNYEMAREFVDTYLIPKMTEIGLYKGHWRPFLDDYSLDFPTEHRETMRNEIKKNWFYYKEK